MALMLTSLVHVFCSAVLRCVCVGRFGNLCRIDCSNQGVCDYSSGQCKCFKGFWGENCNTTVRSGSRAAIQP